MAAWSRMRLTRTTDTITLELSIPEATALRNAISGLGRDHLTDPAYQALYEALKEDA